MVNTISNRNTYNNYINIFLFLFPIILHLAYIYHYSLNVPWNDDYYWYFKYIKDLNENKSNFLEEIITFIQPYNGHLHTPQRIIYLIYIALFHDIDAVFFVMFGNLLFIYLFYLIVRQNIKTLSDVSYKEIAISWIFFQPISYYNFFECAFFNLPVLLFAFLSIQYFYNKNLLYSVILTIICATLNGNGFLIWVIGILVAFDRRNLKQGIIYFVLMILFLLSYTLQPSNMVTSTTVTIVSLWHSFLYFIQLIGKISYWTEELMPWIGLLIGSALIFAFVRNLLKFNNQYKKLFLLMLFMLMSMALISLKRKAVVDGTAIIVDHYLMYPQLFLGCLLYSLTLVLPISDSLKKVIVTFAIILSLTNYLIGTSRVVKHQDYQVANTLNYKEQKKWLLHPLIQGSDEYKLANNVTEYVIDEGYYQLPSFNIKKLESSCQIEENNKHIIVVSDLSDRILNRILLIELVDTNNTKYYFPIEPHAPDLIDWLRSRKNRKIAITLRVNELNEPIDAKSIQSCAIVEVID